MVLPQDKRLKFFVYVIESPSAKDLYHKRSEGEMIEKALSLHHIPSVTRLTISKEAFEASIKIGLLEEMKIFKGLIPIIHISAHGQDSGIQLSNGEEITWEYLKELMSPLNKVLNHSLVLCISSCKGITACQMAMQENDSHPFFAIVANSETPTWADTAIAYSTFYHLIAKGEYVTKAVEAMNIAAGDNNFTTITAEQAQQAYIKQINKLNIEDVQQELQDETNKEPPSLMAKNLEQS